ncbi:Bromodomain-containing protein 7 [Frankliniella fusca]|uniref:Bromodomain-containing protein 7 n=1 Tax=Frankliniella fusca TaxID=407009 RepID=A0AAE1LUT5_9NEOP|nr:Bromodomain-containing protein 7 [Frankliniella fusca]
MSLKKHKKHKSEKRDRHEDKLHSGGDKPPGLRLILKMSNSTPDNSCDSMGPMVDEETSRLSAASSSHLTSVRNDILNSANASSDRSHKKAKKKKKKKEKDRDKHEKKHKHHHKEKRKRREESSQDDNSVGEESLSEPPAKRAGLDGTQTIDEQMMAVAREVDAASREPRSCVLRQRQERSALQRLLEYLLKALEKKDPKQLFAWPVTDHIAPGYSSIISQPMDFSTMKQRIDNGVYMSLSQFIDDFKLLCNNAMVYNQPHTIYYKAAKKLLSSGVKMMSPDKLRPLRSVLTYLGDIGREALGFDVGEGLLPSDLLPSGSPSAAVSDVGTEEGLHGEESMELDIKKKEQKPILSKFEAIPDDLSPEEILEQARRASQTAAAKLAAKKTKTMMGFLRQRKDGTTSLNILVPGDGVDFEKKEKTVLLGAVTGKLTHGTGQLQGFREDRRNLAKTVKPLYYGAFGSYAPSHDSTFANLSKDESDLVYQTYGDEAAVQYAESILDFAKDNDYTITMVDNLLDILTHGEHRRTKKNLEDRRKMREEEERMRVILDSAKSHDSAQPISQTLSSQGAPNPQPQTHQLSQVSIPPQAMNLDSLHSLRDLGIDISFIEGVETLKKEVEEQRQTQVQLNTTGGLIENLQQVQSDRLSTAPPAHLSQVLQPTIAEQSLVEKITENLTDLAKRVPPAAIVPVAGIRKALGVSPNIQNTSEGASSSTSSGHMHVTEPGHTRGTSSANAPGTSAVPDLETELREFLENETSIGNPVVMHDDQSIDEIFSVS